MNPLLVVAGNLIVDDVVFENGITSLGQAGGAALYAALGASLWGISVGIASVVGNDYPDDVLEAVSDKGIDLAGVRRVAGPSLKIWLLYEGRRRQVVHHLDSPSHAQMSPVLADLPSAWRPSAYHLAPMPLAVQIDWLDSLDSLVSPVSQDGSSRVLLSLDLFDLVDEDSLAPLQATFRRVDLALLSEDELLLEAALESPGLCLARLAAGGEGATNRLERILLKRGAQGGLVFDRGADSVRPWQPRASTIVEPTGAGDAFAGGLLAGLIVGRPLEGALEQAIVSASFALEGQGAEGLLAATPADCAARSREWFGGSPG